MSLILRFSSSLTCQTRNIRSCYWVWVSGVNEILVQHVLNKIKIFSGLKQLHDKIRQEAELWFSRMDVQVKSGILNHYGDIPGLEHEYWRLASGPSWCWWILAIMPLDQIAQVNIGHSHIYRVSTFIAISYTLGTLCNKISCLLSNLSYILTWNCQSYQ